MKINNELLQLVHDTSKASSSIYINLKNKTLVSYQIDISDTYQLRRLQSLSNRLLKKSNAYNEGQRMKMQLISKYPDDLFNRSTIGQLVKVTRAPAE